MRKVIIGVLITIVLVGGILIVDRNMRMNNPQAAKSDTDGKNLPTDVTLSVFGTDKTVQLKSFAGKVVLINFWASWCEACMAEMPSIQKLYDTLKGEGFEVIAINVDDNPASVVPPIIKKLNLTFPIYTEKDSAASDAFGVAAIPFSVVADRQQKIVSAESGEKDWSTPEVIGEIKKLLKPI